MSAYYYALVAASKKVLVKIGDSSVTADTGAPASGDRAWMSKYTCSATATYTSARVKAFTSGNAAGDHWKFLVYADNAGTPGNLIYASASTPNVGGASAITTFTISVALTNGTVYWLGVVSDSFNGQFGYVGLPGTLDRCETLTFASPGNNPTVAASGTGTLALDAFVYL